ncbi:hypothetical protein K788_0002004 (plasmid) [Paraburkholderia caribensis MBA4]|uniref:Uncharacterized protein n=1 Tax=Paraburkholderia caribensis MBA4 TaxID=1323664 RepID=A0A0P0RQ83_9BURK|nr:hypothetical protein [Paraburkholderia caribensis]ALL71175.1 hypothetical protein K788_0002004 [Paraburkholderia caribensis MBA4]
MKTIVIASKDAVGDIARDKRTLTRQMLRPPERVSVEPEMNHGKSIAWPEAVTGFARAKNGSLCPVALDHFMRTSNAYLLARASEDVSSHII